jgi:hypothetical protein
MAIFSQLPATLNLRFVRGDTVSIDVDFDLVLTNYTLDAAVVIPSSGATLLAIGASIVSGPNGIVNLSLTSENTAALEAGTYAWELVWESPAGVVRKALSGSVLVKDR